MIEVSSTHQHNVEQADAAFRNMAELLGKFRDRLTEQGFTESGAESMTELLMNALLDD